MFTSHPSRWLFAFGILIAAAVSAPAAAKPGAAKDDFMPYVELAPFVINGEKLSVYVHARTKKDRRYAEDLAEEVVKVVNEAVTKETGKGLVIVGKKGEPHPIFIFRKFLALADENKLDPAIAARAPELSAMLTHWEDGVSMGDKNGKGVHIESDGDEDDVEFEKIVTALPLPLEGLGSSLYQLAWAEGFDDAKVEKRFRGLHAADLTGNQLARFDWVFYLPPRGALESALDEIIAEALKEEKMGFFERTAVKGAMLIVKPMIRKAIEGVRQGVMFDTVVQARTPYSREEVSSLTSAYLGVLMPGEKEKTRGTEHERAVKAVREAVKELAEKPAPAERTEEPSEPKPEA